MKNTCFTLSLLIFPSFLFGNDSAHHISVNPNTAIVHQIPDSIHRRAFFRNDRAKEIDSLIKHYNLHDPFYPPFFEKNLEGSFIKLAENLIASRELSNNKSFLIYLHHRLAIVYGARTVHKHGKALEHLEQAKALAKADPERYHLQLGMIYDHMAVMYEATGDRLKASFYWKKLITDYQGIGEGSGANLVSLSALSGLRRYYLQERKDTTGFAAYLRSIVSTQPKNEISYAALSELIKLSLLTDKSDEASKYEKQLVGYPDTRETRRMKAEVQAIRQQIEKH